MSEKVLLNLDGSGASAQARILIRQYHESEWRSTRIEVVKKLGQFDDPRSFQFLVDIIKRNEDLSEQQFAIIALSQRKNSTAARFLRYFYLNAPDTLKAHLAFALGQVQDEASVPVLLNDLKLGLDKQDQFLIKNIILALGELKAFEALPQLRQFLSEQTGSEPGLIMAVLFALGRLERDPRFLLSQKSRFLEDSLQYQIFQASLSQIQVRSQFKLEDYLSKVFSMPDPHPVLPLELRAFDSVEVELGMSLFPIEKHWQRSLLALKGIAPENRVSHYDKILKMLRADSPVDESTFWDEIKNETAHRATLDWAVKVKPSSSDAHLKWMECCVEAVDWGTELAPLLLRSGVSGSDAFAIQALNLWNEWALNQAPDKLLAMVLPWFDIKLSDPVQARLIRACAELQLGNKALVSRWLKDLSSSELKSSILIALERFPQFLDHEAFLKAVQGWTQPEKESYGTRILSVIESYASKTSNSSPIELLLKAYSESVSVDLRGGVLKVLREQPFPKFENFVIDQLSEKNPQLELNAVIALKAYSASSVASEALAQKLKSLSLIIQGRALDALCAHASLFAKRAVMVFLKDHLADEVIVDKIYRSFDPQQKGGPEFAKEIALILEKNPEHPQWEKLVQLRDRLNTVSEVTAPKDSNGPAKAAGKSEALKEVDKRLIEVIPQFLKLDPMVQAALRAAEEPFRGTEEMQNLPIDKAPTVLEYCKALDLILERYLGQKFLFPKLDTSLHDFQTIWHKIGFMEDYPSAEKVMGAIGIKGKMSPEHFPLHKAKMMASTFFNGKIVQDRFKVFDGLRAWAVILLVFTRKLPAATGVVGPLLKLPNANDEESILVAKRLMVLQDLRNPAAHRQTYTHLASVLTFRAEAIQLLNTILKFYD